MNVAANFYCWIACVLMLCALPAFAFGQEFSAYDNPDPFLGPHFRENRGTIEQLAAVAEDQAKPSDERTKALVKLRNQFTDASINTLVKLVHDDDEKVAALAGDLLSSASMMMDHKVYGDTAEHENPYMKYAMQKRDLIYKGLRESVQDKRPAVRAYAAQSLASQSDEKGLALIAKGKEEEAYTDEEFVKVMSLSTPAASGKYLVAYLDSGDEKVMKQVSGFLAESAEYSGAVVEKVFLNPDAKMAVRIEAAKHLPNQNLLQFMISPEAPPTLYAEAMKTYVNRTSATLSKREVKILIDRLEKVDPEGSQFNEMKTNLKNLYDKK